MVHLTTNPERHPIGPSTHLTAQLALYLLQHTPQRLRSKCSSPTSSSSGLLPTSTIQCKIMSLQRALRDDASCSSSATPLPFKRHGSTHSGSTLSFASLINKSNSPATATVSAPSSTTSSDAISWEEEDEEDDESDPEARSRVGAAARALSRNREDSVSDLEDACCADIRRRHYVDEWSAAMPLDEFDHPALTPVVAALHAYTASGGDTVFLEKGYELARAVAASKHDLRVAVDACRMALAVGYVHTLTKGESNMANTFALKYSLPKLAQSLKPFWSCSPDSADEAEVEWEECVMSLLEVTSSVALMTDETNILAVLDAKVYGGVAEAVGMYVMRSPGALQQYPDVGRACLRRHLLPLESGCDVTDTE